MEFKMQDQDFGSTQYFKVEKEPENGVKVILAAVYEALTEKGYNPVDQIVGYIMSGDPTYITSHKNARGMIMRCPVPRYYVPCRKRTGNVCVLWDWILGQRRWVLPSVTLY